MSDDETTEDVDERDPLGWHTISGSHLLEVMRRCKDEDPDIVFAELWANAEHNRVEPS